MATVQQPAFSRPRQGSHSGSSLGPPGQPAASSLGLRVSKLLGSSFEDAGTRAALETLSVLPLASTSTPGATGDKAEDGRPTGATVGHKDLKRGGLRREIEGRMAERSREFLGIFTEVNLRLAELQGHLDEMHACCDQVQAKLNSAHSGTKFLLEHAEGLRQQSASTANKQLLAQLFLSRFTLSPSEISSLTSRELPVDRSLFAAMDHCTRIRADCAVLLAGSASSSSLPASLSNGTAEGSPGIGSEAAKDGPRAGLDIMNATSEYLDKGYAKLFKWCSFECRGTLSRGGEAQIEVSTLMREAIRRLKGRPEMLEEILATLSTTRSTSLLNLFLEALTRGGPSGLPRPIELHAHDPLRYIGDMLAWIHQTMAGEHEFLESLFDLKSDANRRVGEPRVFEPRLELSSSTATGSQLDLSSEGLTTTTKTAADEVKEDRERSRQMLDKDLEGCARPLKIRVHQTIRSQEGSIVTYQIATLIHFYKITMEKSVGNDALISKTLAEITDAAYQAFFDTLAAEGRSLLRFVQPPPADLSAPPQLLESLSSLREIMAVYATSLVDADGAGAGATPKVATIPIPFAHDEPIGVPPVADSATEPSAPSTDEPVEEKRRFKTDFEDVLDAALEPALAMCAKMAEHRPTNWDRSVLLVNCLELCHLVLEPFGFTAVRRAQLREEVAKHVGTLTDEHHASLVKDSGLQPILQAIDETPAETPLSHVDAASPRSINTAVRLFDRFLAELDPLTSPRLALLATVKTASSIHRTAVARVSGVYDRVYDAVMDERNRYEFRSTILVRSKEEVRTLLVA